MKRLGRGYRMRNGWFALALLLPFSGCDRPESLLQQGNMAYRRGDAKKAVELYERAGRDTSTRAAASYNLGRVYFEQGEFARAQTLFDQAMPLVLDNPMIRVYRARAALGAGDMEQGEKDLRLSVRLHPELGDGHFYLARLLADRGDYEGALKTMEGARGIPGMREAATLLMADWNSQIGKPRVAAALLEELLSTHGSRYETYLELGRNLKDAGDYGRAEAFLRRGLAINPGDPEGLFQLGIVFEEQSKIDLAIELHKAVVEKGKAPWAELAEARLKSLETAR